MKCEQTGSPRLSKSKFLAGLQCLKRLYFQAFAPELRAEPDELTQARFDQGEEVGKLACLAFPGGVLIDKPHWDILGGVEATGRLLADDSVPAIFEATFLHNNVAVRVDILERLAGGAWRCIEVKSSTRVKDEHIPDVAIQKHVLEGCGLDVGACCLMHLSRDYVFEGGEYDLTRLFRIEDLSDRLLPIEQGLAAHLEEQMEVLARETTPTVEPGPHCTQPYECEFYDQCNEELPADHVTRL